MDMNTEPGDKIWLFSDQVRGCYLHGHDHVPHTARPGEYEVLEVQGEAVVLGIRRTMKGGMDIFLCSMQGLRAVVLDHNHFKPE